MSLLKDWYLASNMTIINHKNYLQKEGKFQKYAKNFQMHDECKIVESQSTRGLRRARLTINF